MWHEYLQVPTVGEFELVVENVQQLREMCEKFAEPDPVSVRKGRKVILYERLKQINCLIFIS